MRGNYQILNSNMSEWYLLVILLYEVGLYKQEVKVWGGGRYTLPPPFQGVNRNIFFDFMFYRLDIFV